MSKEGREKSSLRAESSFESRGKIRRTTEEQFESKGKPEQQFEGGEQFEEQQDSSFKRKAGESS